jgi:hypothetical protein
LGRAVTAVRPTGVVVKAARTVSTGLAFATLTALIAVTRLTFALAITLFTLRKVGKVPLSRLVKWHLSERTHTRHASQLRQFTLEVAVDRQVSSDVPSLVVYTFRLTAGNVVKDQMVELVLENTTNLLFWQAGKEVRVVDHLKLSSVGIYPHTRCWDTVVSTLLNLARQSSKERLVH